jgi:hypothetical protein
LFHPHDRYPSHSPSSRSHYDASQPRVPRGHPDGGQWTSGYGLLSDLAELHTIRGLHDRVASSRGTEQEYPLWPLPVRKLTPQDAPDWWPEPGEGDPGLLVRLAAMPWPDKRDRVFGQGELPLEAGRSGGGGSLPSLPFRRFFRRSPTAGVLRTPKGDFEIVSGTGGPAASIPKGTPGFDGRVRLHAEGQAVAYMIREGITEATLYLNQQRICLNCEKLLRFKLPPGFKLNVVLPNGITRQFGAKR